jgi:heptosyltransferase-2
LNKFLVIQTAFIGDVILATSLLENLHQAYPKAKIDLVVRKGNEPLFENHPYLNNVFVWKKTENKYKNLFKLIKKVRRDKYDVTINLQRYFASGFISLRSKAYTKIGYKSNPLSLFYSKKIEHSIGDGKHEVERNYQLVKEFVNSEICKPKLYPNTTNYDKIKSINLPKDYIVIAPASVWFTKRLPKSKFIELIILNSYASKIVLIGAPSDYEYCESILNESNAENVINLAGKLNLLDSTALIEKAKMSYVNDSAPLHLASSVNAPVTAFFCSTIPDFGFGPLSDSSIVLQVKEKLDCRPCGLHGKSTCPKGHFKCGNDLTLS